MQEQTATRKSLGTGATAFQLIPTLFFICRESLTFLYPAFFTQRRVAIC